MHDALIWLPGSADPGTEAGVSPYLAPWDHTIWATCITTGLVVLLGVVALALSALS